MGDTITALGEIAPGQARWVIDAGGLCVSPGFVVSWPVDRQLLNDFREQALAVMHEGSVDRELLEGFGQPGFFNRDPDPYSEFAGEVDWVGTDQPFFVSAILPDSPFTAVRYG